MEFVPSVHCDPPTCDQLVLQVPAIHRPPDALICPACTSSLKPGPVVPIPTLPEETVNAAPPEPVKRCSFPVSARKTTSPIDALLLQLPLPSANPRNPLAVVPSYKPYPGSFDPLCEPSIRIPSPLEPATTYNLLAGVVVPMPTLPELVIRILSFKML